MATKTLVSLQQKDKKLVTALDFHARDSYAQLAREIRLSKQGTEYKVKRLLEKGVIKGFYPVVNVPKLGYLYCRLLVTLQNVTREQHSEILSFLKRHKKVFWLFQMQGSYDLLIVIWANTVTEFREFSLELEGKYGQHIKTKNETIGTDVVHYQHRYLTGKEHTEEIHIAETEERIVIDDIDKKILQELCNDARASLVSIAGKVKESAKVVAYRIRRLEKQKLIEGYRTIINHNVLGYTYYKILLQLNDKSKKERAKLIAHIKTQPIAIYVIEGVGVPGDLDIEVMVASNAELFSFIEDLRFRFPHMVGEYHTVIFMDTMKVRYLPF